MMQRPTVVISPHLDDAVLSVGQTMAAMGGGITGPVTVVTALAGYPEEHVLSEYDRDRGWASSSAAMAQRFEENDRACGILGVDHLELPFLDRQYGGAEERALVEALAREITRSASTRVLIPLGIGHDDHRLVARLARAATRRNHDEVFIYEELPYRVWWPEQVSAAVSSLFVQGWRFAAVPHPFPTVPLSQKRDALACYSSQLGPVEEHDPCFYVPERVWQVVR